jgi:transcriptional regulator with XRE-family HTH domain
MKVVKSIKLSGPLRPTKDSSDQLLALRERTGLNQTQFANLMGLLQPHYSRLEAGDRQPTKIHMSAATMAAFIAEFQLLAEFEAYLVNLVAEVADGD